MAQPSQIYAFRNSMAAIILLIVGVFIFVYLARQIDFRGWLQEFGFDRSGEGAWYTGPLGFVLIASLASAMAAPRQAVAFSAAFFFGLGTGLLTAWAAAMLGCVLTYFGASLFRKQVLRFVSGRLAKAVGYWKANTVPLTILIRLLPAGSNYVTSVSAGALAIPPVRFFVGTGIGYIPQTVIFALIGSGVDVGSEAQLAFGLGLLIASIAMGWWLYRRSGGGLSGRV